MEFASYEGARWSDLDRPLRPAPLDLGSDIGTPVLLEACDQLETFVLNQLPGEGLRFGPQDPRALVWPLAFRSLKSFDSLLLLANAGYGEQAMILSRTLFEDMVVAWWVSSQPGDSMVDLLERNEKGASRIYQKPHARRGDLSSLHGVPVLDADLLDEWAGQDGLKPDDGRRLWTRKPVSKMVNAIRPQVPEQDQEVLDLLANLAYSLTSLIVHNSPVSMSAAVQSGGWAGDRPANLLSRLPSRKFSRDAIVLGYHALGLLARCISEQDASAKLDGLLAVGRFACHYVPPGELTRNDPCTCGSGLKYKKCHGR